MDEKELHVRPIDFLYLYPNSLAEARRLGETQQYDDSFHLNVDCARAIEKAIRDHFDEDTEVLKEGCAQSVLERFGFKRTNFVLANSLKEFKKSACKQLVSEETYQWGSQIFVPLDGRYNRYFAADTAAGLLEAFIGQAREAYQALNLFGPEHCTGDRNKQDFTAKVLVMSPDTLREACWDARNMLWYGEGGFGCSPDSRGRAVYATCLSDGEKTRWNRSDFIGVLDGQFLPDWAMEKLEELRGPGRSRTTPTWRHDHAIARFSLFLPALRAETNTSKSEESTHESQKTDHGLRPCAGAGRDPHLVRICGGGAELHPLPQLPHRRHSE